MAYAEQPGQKNAEMNVMQFTIRVLHTGLILLLQYTSADYATKTGAIKLTLRPYLSCEGVGSQE